MWIRATSMATIAPATAAPTADFCSPTIENCPPDNALPSAPSTNGSKSTPSVDGAPVSDTPIATKKTPLEILMAKRELYRGTGIGKRSGGRPKGQYIQMRRPSKSRAKKVVEEEVVLDLGAKLGICKRCTCPVHEADITDGYAIQCPEGGFECFQDTYADSCAEYAANHQSDVATLLPPLLASIAAEANEGSGDAPSSAPQAADAAPDDGTEMLAVELAAEEAPGVAE